MPPRGGKGQWTPLSRKSTPREPSSGTGGTSGPMCVASLRSSRVLCVSNVRSPPEADCVFHHVRGWGWGRGLLPPGPAWEARPSCCWVATWAPAFLSCAG